MSNLLRNCVNDRILCSLTPPIRSQRQAILWPSASQRSKREGGKDQGEKLARGGHSEKVPAVNQLLTVLWPIPTRSPTGCALMSVHQ